MPVFIPESVAMRNSLLLWLESIRINGQVCSLLCRQRCWIYHFQHSLTQSVYQAISRSGDEDEKLRSGFYLPINLPVEGASRIAVKCTVAFNRREATK